MRLLVLDICEYGVFVLMDCGYGDAAVLVEVPLVVVVLLTSTFEPDAEEVDPLGSLLPD